MNTLSTGSSLKIGERITSPNGQYWAGLLEEDGNFVVNGPTGTVWSTETSNKGAVRADVQEDGNFVLYKDDNSPVWASDTSGGGAHLVIQDDRNLVLYAADGSTVLWSPNSYLSDEERAAAQVTPVAQETPAAEAPAQRTYVVQSGDTLSKIAREFYGNASDYGRIAEANGIANPDLIHPGQNLIIP